MNSSSSPPIAVSSAGYSFGFDELADDVFRFREQVGNGGVAALSTDDGAVVAAALVALEGWAGEVRLIPPALAATAPETLAGTTQLAIGDTGPLDSTGAVAAEQIETRWIVYTSGTTGEPKAISHTRRSLSRTVATGAGSSFVWGLLYDPNRMAGLQVLLQALLGGSVVVAARPDAPIGERIEALTRAGVNALSATPTLWRQMLQLPATKDMPLRQITLGGEIADQRILNALADAFPSARIVHVFASTETGAAFSVKDGREGFPISYLDEPPHGIRLQIRDDILHVYSPAVSAAGDDGFASTGDVVELVDDRVLFRGRASGVVNVGGSNVWPEVVESILRSHADVLEAVVSSKPNPMTGNVLVATARLRPGADADAAPKVLRSWVRQHAPRTHVPASVAIVDELDVSSTGKVVR